MWVYSIYVFNGLVYISTCFTVTMNTQNHVTLKTSPYNVVFGIEPASELFSELTAYMYK